MQEKDSIIDEDQENTLEAYNKHAEEWDAIKASLTSLPAVQQETVKRWNDIQALQEHYVHFSDFVYDCMTELMGFTCSPLQLDIALSLQNAPKYFMVQAQRSQAKSTIAAMFGVWKLIHKPTDRILIISAGSDLAMEIANWVIQIIMNWDILECLRPDRQHGDRASSKAFDIHWQLKGVEKSPSVACIGVTANMQGRRADLLIPDDIESSKNGLTEVQRQGLIHKSRDFTSICQKGQILYLGTPQTSDSIYNTLPGRGYIIRIWPGRYPTLEQEKNYGDHLAPYIRKQMEEDPSLRTGGGPLGDEGQPTDPVLLPEALLLAKELDQGKAYFQLQHMLNTELVDADRYPLNTRDLVVMPLNPDKAPGEIIWMPDKEKQIITEHEGPQAELYRPFSVSRDLYDYESRYMYVDTSGGGALGDEQVAWAIYFLHGYLFGYEMLVLPGGYSEEIYIALSEFALRNLVNEIGVEQNFGHGALAQNWRPVLLRYYSEQTGLAHAPKIVDDWVNTQKELRIIDTLGPIMGRHRLVINESVLEYDARTVKKRPLEVRQTYTLLNQINKVTRDHGALIHDDRIDSLAGGVRRFVDRMAIDETIRIEQKMTNETMQMMQEWSQDTNKTRGLGNILARKGSRSKRKRR